MEKPRITNVWATIWTDETCRRAASRIVVEATSMPSYRVHAASCAEVRIDLPDSMLAMAPGSVSANDGLVAMVTVSAGPKGPFVLIQIEHAPRWTVAEVPGRPARIVMDLDRDPIRAAFEGKLIVVDPGHGGVDIGGRGPVNLVEKRVTLEIGRLLAGYLQLAGAGVVMTRTADEEVPKRTRLARATAVGADACVSVHTLVSSNPALSGTRTSHAGDPRSESLARRLQAALVEKLPVVDRGIARFPGRLPRDFRIPCVSVEVAAISNWVEEGWFRSITFKERAAEAMVTGLKRYFLESAQETTAPQEKTAGMRTVPAKADAIPIRTHLIGEGEQLAGVVQRYTCGIAEPGDVIAVAESVVAIAQGRAVLPESVHPSMLARMLCKLPGKDGSLATPPAMQLAIKEVGAPRVLLGTVAAGVGKLLGRKGDFFRVAGRSIAQIDDIAGTLPPYDKHVILGPAGPEDVAREIRRATGCDAAVVDVNDIGYVDVLGLTAPAALDWVSRSLLDNPFGNDDQQTPIVVLKPRR